MSPAMIPRWVKTSEERMHKTVLGLQGQYGSGLDGYAGAYQTIGRMRSSPRIHRRKRRRDPGSRGGFGYNC